LQLIYDLQLNKKIVPVEISVIVLCKYSIKVVHDKYSVTIVTLSDIRCYHV